ncbi:hypothetical protein ACFL1A_01770 [Patescibacteria group bacterium]
MGLSNRRKLATTEGISRKTLSCRLKPFFNNPLTPQQVWKVLPPKLTKTKHPWIYATDGKWLKRQGVVIIHRDITNKENIYWSWWKSESYLAYSSDIQKLSDLFKDNLPSGAVSDWLGAIVEAVNTHFGDIAHQRCLTHVVRHAKRYLAKNSPFRATRILRKIASELIHIKDQNQKRLWLIKLIKWEKEYDYMLKEKTIAVGIPNKRWWYTHGDLRRGFRLLTHSWCPFFVHLNHSLIPHSNNSIEAVIGQMKNKLNDHRGMKHPQQVLFLFWYLTFTRAKTRLDLKKLWVEWKKTYFSELSTQKVT